MRTEHIVANKNSLALQKPISIERRDASEMPYDRFVERYIVSARPVVIENSATGWAALRDWTPEFFRRRFGSRTVPIADGLQMSFNDFVDALSRSTPEKPGPYLHRVIIHRDLPDLLPDLTPEIAYGFPRRYCSPLMPKRMRRPDGYLKLLIGGPGSTFPVMHYDHDNANALITGIYGEKEFVLFSPEDTPFIYPNADSPHTSQIRDLENPDYERFPVFAQAKQYRGVVGPGDAIFVPSGWWHSARVLTTSVSVCVNMLDASNWSGFVDDVCQAAYVRGWKSVLKRFHLNALGAVLTLIEAAQTSFPGSRLMRTLAPPAPVGPGRTSKSR